MGIHNARIDNRDKTFLKLLYVFVSFGHVHVL